MALNEIIENIKSITFQLIPAKDKFKFPHSFNKIISNFKLSKEFNENLKNEIDLSI